MYRTVIPFVLTLLIAGNCDGQSSQSGFSDRNPRYRLQAGDVLEVMYRYTPEFNQSVTVQPDGFITLNLVGDIKAGGLTVPDAKVVIGEKSSVRLRDPEVSIVLKEYVKPHFVVAGEVTAPGRFELRGSMTALEAVAMAGGLKASAKHSQAILYRKVEPEMAEAKLINLKQLATLQGIVEDFQLRNGDVLLVPQNRISKIERFVKWGNFGVYANPIFR
jgi:polysaccharide export outer membrane protein